MALSSTVHLRGSWLLGTRVLWVAIIALTFILTLFALPQQVRDIVTNRAGALGSEQPLSDLGLTVEFYAGYVTFWDVFVIVVYSAVGLLMFWRRSDSLIVTIISLGLITLAPSILTLVLPAVRGVPFLLQLVNFVAGLGWLLMLYLFPDGKLVPRWSGVLLALAGLAWAWAVFATQIEAGFMPDSDMVSVLLLVGFLLLPPVFLQIRRYRINANEGQRQQARWVMLGAVIAILGYVMLLALPEIFPSLYEPTVDRLVFYFLIGYGVRALLLCALPVCFAIAMLKYHLWNVDLIVNRSLVYGIVTLALAAVFTLSVLLLQSLLGGANPVVALVVSAIGPIALFNPVRKQIQRFIDRRVYRLNFDLNQLAAAQKKPIVKNAGAHTGKTIAGYQVLGVLGKGGMGEVYQGENNGKFVALKILPDDLAKQPEFVSRFQREADTMRALKHPNIVKIVSAGEDSGVRYLALEYIEGVDLGAYITQHGKMTHEDTRALMRDMASALDHAHKQGLVHRDIKASNIMLRGDDPPQAILMDFGIAKIKDAVTRYTGSGAIGTIDYMAPEQIMAAKEVDLRADVYALGVLAYEMLTGEKPFKGSAAQVMFAHLQQPPPDACALVKEIPKSCGLAIQRALVKDPKDRYESAGEFAAAL